MKRDLDYILRSRRGQRELLRAYVIYKLNEKQKEREKKTTLLQKIKRMWRNW